MASNFSASAIRADFPVLSQYVNDHPLIYLDNAATTQKPQCVLDALNHYYRDTNANVHRASHTLSAQATFAFEQAREKLAGFINANSSKEIIWTRGTTEAINLVAQSFGGSLKAGDEILLTMLEHHANIVPWQMLAQRTGAVIKVVPVNQACELDLDKFNNLLNEKTRLVSLTQVSNAVGSINPVKQLIELSHQTGAKVLVDGAQAVSHWDIDVQQLDCDFYAFSGHKMFGPTGMGVLYGKEQILEAMPPWQGGGEMIHRVSFEHTSYNELPFKFEAGTPNIAGAISLASAVDYLHTLDRSGAAAHEQALLRRAESLISQINNIELVGRARQKTGVLSFVLKGEHSADVGALLDMQGIAVRTGHHCAMPLMDFLNIKGTVRASFSIYNTMEEVEYFAEALNKVTEFL